MKSPLWYVNTGCRYEDRVCCLKFSCLFSPTLHSVEVPLYQSPIESGDRGSSSRLLLLPSVSFSLLSSLSSWISHIRLCVYVCVCERDRLCIMGFNWSLWGGFRVFWGFKNSKVWTQHSDSRSPGTHSVPSSQCTTYLHCCVLTEQLNNSVGKMAICYAAELCGAI